MTDQPETTDPIERMPKQLQAANRRKRAEAAAMGNPPAQPEQSAPPSVESLLDRIERLEAERAASQFVESQPPPKPHTRVAEDEELTPFQRELKSQTTETPPAYQRQEVGYNYPLRWFAKQDGSVVQLQGDPGNRSYYRDKGFVELSPSQVERYLKTERLEILKLQQAKANLIENIRRVFSIDKVLQAGAPKFEEDKDEMTVAELEAVWAEITHSDDGKPRFRLSRPRRLQDADDRRAQADTDRMLAGVETTPSRTARAQFETLQEQIRSGRQVEVTSQSRR